MIGDRDGGVLRLRKHVRRRLLKVGLGRRIRNVSRCTLVVAVVYTRMGCSEFLCSSKQTLCLSAFLVGC